MRTLPKLQSHVRDKLSSIWGFARSGRNVGQPNHILVDWIAGHKAEAWAGSGEEGLAVAEDDGMEIEAVFVDETGVGEGSREVRAAYFDVAGQVGLQAAYRGLDVLRD